MVAGCLGERNERLAVTKGRLCVVVAEVSLRRREMELDPIARRFGSAIAEAALVPQYGTWLMTSNAASASSA